MNTYLIKYAFLILLIQIGISNSKLFAEDKIKSTNHCFGPILVKKYYNSLKITPSSLAAKALVNLKKEISKFNFSPITEKITNDDSIHFANMFFFEKKISSAIKTISSEEVGTFNDFKGFKFAFKINPNQIIHINIENSVQKNLNDIFENKQLVDEINEIYKNLFYKNIKQVKISANSSREAYHQLENFFIVTAEQFNQVMESSGIAKILENQRGILASPKHWFAGGVDETSADASGIFARLARNEFDPALGNNNPIRLRNNLLDLGTVEKNRQLTIVLREHTTNLFKHYQKNLKPSPIIPVDGTNKFIPSADLLEIFRKGAPPKLKGYKAYFSYMQKTIEDTFPQFKFDTATLHENIKLLRKYYNLIDSVIPGLINPKKISHYIETSPEEVISFDIAGLGAWNAEAVAKALTLTEGQSFNTAIAELRYQNELVTDKLKNISNIITETAEEVFGIKFKNLNLLTFSGDDGILKFPKGFSNKLDKDIDIFLKLLSEKLIKNHFTPKRIRMTRVGKWNDQSLLNRKLLDSTINEMESIEKALRKELRQVKNFAQEDIMFLFQNINHKAFSCRVLGASKEKQVIVKQKIVKVAADKRLTINSAADITFVHM